MKKLILHLAILASAFALAMPLAGCALSKALGDDTGAAPGEGTGVACAEQIGTLGEVCPAGTSPHLTAAGFAQCEGMGDVDLTDDQGNISGVCRAEGECDVYCEEVAALACECGLVQVTPDEYTCRLDCPDTCGNGTRESGEECDLGAELNGTGLGCSATCKLSVDGCAPSYSYRCAGAHLLVCLDAQWTEEEDCRDADQVCAAERCVNPCEDTPTALLDCVDTECESVPAEARAECAATLCPDELTAVSSDCQTCTRAWLAEGREAVESACVR